MKRGHQVSDSCANLSEWVTVDLHYGDVDVVVLMQ